MLRGQRKMNTISYGLLIGLAIALVIAAFTDMKRRQIDNWLNALIALTAPAFWWASGLDLWPGVATQLGVATAAFFILAGLFALKWMGGGDVKLLTALALWVPPYVFMQLLLIMALAGGALTIMLGGWHIIRGERDKIKIPYGIAIAFGGLWVLWANYLPGVSFAAQSA